MNGVLKYGTASVIVKALQGIAGSLCISRKNEGMSEDESFGQCVG